MEQEKRLRREIANSNERRRMQSINAGFQSLRGLLPHQEGEKLSKAAILQQTADYIFQLEQERTKLINQTTQLKRLVASQNGESLVGSSGSTGSSVGNHNGVYSSPHSPAAEIPPPIAKRRKTIDGAVESADEGIGNMSPEHSGSGEESRGELMELRRETMELRIALERERRHRISMEEHIGLLQQQSSPHQMYVTEGNHERMQVVVEAETYPPPIYGRHVEETRCGGPMRNNLETIVEAIRHLEGDLFVDECKYKTITPSPSASSPRAMEICNSPQVSPSHSSDSQSMIEVPLPSPPQQLFVQQQMPGTNFVSSMTPPVSNSTTVTSLKHHVLNRIARSSAEPEAEEQPINLVSFRPIEKKDGGAIHVPFSLGQHNLSPFHIQQQFRPNVIVAKQS